MSAKFRFPWTCALSSIAFQRWLGRLCVKVSTKDVVDVRLSVVKFYLRGGFARAQAAGDGVGHEGEAPEMKLFRGGSLLPVLIDAQSPDLRFA